MEKKIEEEKKTEEEKLNNEEKKDDKNIDKSNNENQKIESQKKSKIKLPKRKYAIIHGYSGHNYSGNQKNPGVKTIEEELEKCLYEGGFISECNYGCIQKIDWMRASRTDKGVSAVMNVISVKLHKYPDLNENDMKNKINNLLPKDIKIFRFIEVSDRFDSKDNNNNREYHYIIPTFCLEPKNENNNNNDDNVDIDKFVGNYKFKLSRELHDKCKKVCSEFLGTKKYHNYTKKVGFSDPSSQRHIYELNCDEIINFDEFECIKFKIVGQSFLYNQIRKMIGMIIEIMRNCKDIVYLQNSFLSNKLDVAKAPAEGLYLMKIDYSKYNDRKLNKKNNIFITEDDQKEMDEFAEMLIDDIHKVELNEHIFSKWLWKFDNKRETVI